MTSTLLTSDELDHWNTLGYLHIRNALSPEAVSPIRTAIDDLHERLTLQPGTPWPNEDADQWDDVFDAGNERDLSVANAIRHIAEGPVLPH